MSSKSELLARIEALSVQLGRELPRSGTNAELEMVIASAEAEVEMLGEPADEQGEIIREDLTEGSGRRAEGAIETDSEPGVTRPVRLRTTLDIYHYMNGERVREIVAAGRKIVIDSSEASTLIAAGHAGAL
ncbi:DNA-packaging protein [Salmonella enterica subsp. salamae]|nr:DNA-packaging protein [Salmonella enterica subsp. salamae]EDR7342098.1 DNA-packaging protein [Salmonella enterica subsp. salamae]HAV0413610.1 DNA-packaging protein [Salmonella enterica]